MLLFPIPPLRNQAVRATYHAKAFSDADCDRILASLDDAKWEEGLVGQSDPQAGYELKANVRRCLQQILPVDQAGFPLSVLSHFVCGANSQYWGFDLTGFVGDDMPWVMKYTGEVGGHNDWHVDIGRLASASRKLGLSIQLSHGSDYVGGDLEFHNQEVDTEGLRQRGTLAIFPAYWMHRVTPVTAGTRIALVGWVHGPSFR